MLEKTPVLDLICHLILLLGAALVCLPLYFVFVTGTLSQESSRRAYEPTAQQPVFRKLATILEKASFGRQLLNSFVVALGVTVGKLSISIIAAFAVTYFRFPFRKTAFWLIFVSLMLPIEVRIVPTYKSAANVALPLNVLSTWFDLSGLFSRIAGRDVEVGLDWNMVNTYPGLILPLIASATATFLFRQFFLTVPDELLEAALIDGARPMQFFRLILLPLSRSNIIALGIILFLAG